jgi:hypothetical protein
MTFVTSPNAAEPAESKPTRVIDQNDFHPDTVWVEATFDIIYNDGKKKRLFWHGFDLLPEMNEMMKAAMMIRSPDILLEIEYDTKPLFEEWQKRVIVLN